MLPDLRDYQSLYDSFVWQIPRHFNIGTTITDAQAARRPDGIAIIDATDAGRIVATDFAQLAGLSNRIANVLAAHGIGRGDRVAVVLPQCAETAAVHAAVYKLGAIAVPLAMLFGIEALRYRLETSGARAVVASRASLDKLAEATAGLAGIEAVWSIDGAGEGARSLPDDLAKASDRFTAAETGADDPCLMIFTSGTTGQPKGALHAHRALLGHIPGVQFAHEFFPQAGDMTWTPSDWAWAGGLLNILLPSLYFGIPVVACRFEKFEPARAWALLARQPIRNVFIPPTALKLMRGATPARARESHRLRTVFSGGEAVGRGLQTWSQEALGLKINEIYGQTECNLVLESCAAIGVWKAGVLGRPVPGHRVAIVDGGGRELAAGEAGTIAIHRPDPVMFLEYWNQPQATRDKFAGDWLLTGDQGVRDEEGYFHFVGRDDDVITSSGYRIGPGEIEDCLIGHPAVKLAAVVGKPDELRTEIVKAFVVLNDGYRPGDELAAEIREHVRTRLSAHEYPREVEFRAELPLTTTGKVIRRLLRAQG